MKTPGILLFWLFLVIALCIIYTYCIRLWKVFFEGEPHEILIRPMFYDFDETRIRKYFEERAFEIENITYKPGAYGWIGSRNSIYLVTYRDKLGEMKSVLAKTGFFAGVYISAI